MSHPYATPGRLTLKCVKTHVYHKASSFSYQNSKIEISSYKTSAACALTDGSRAILHKKNGPDPEFEEGASYILRKSIISKRYGRLYLLLERKYKFRTAPINIPEEAERAAKDALCPPSALVTGEEEDIFSKNGYLSLQGKVEKLHKPRMTRSEIPILDLKLRCGASLLDVSLWRDEALTNLHEEDQVEISHLHASLLPKGNGKFNSSAFTTIKIEEPEIKKEEIEVIGVTEDQGNYTLLTEDDKTYEVPASFYSGNFADLIKQLPMRLSITHKNNHVMEINAVENDNE
ncbi:uncharacterized protein [Misgurnus anguillicaudatus]|uniref:uncharacterized protein n=1 Tax=Misgurnus anguillicaudatus TaxID=75329 RepID=UPI003CCF4A7E